jgi:hypothetical protein
MELERDGLVSPMQEVPVIEGELVATIRELASRGVGSKTIARTVGGGAQYRAAISAGADRTRGPGPTGGSAIDGRRPT